jgi:hypothetical protein
MCFALVWGDYEVNLSHRLEEGEELPEVLAQARERSAEEGVGFVHH